MQGDVALIDSTARMRADAGVSDARDRAYCQESSPGAWRGRHASRRRRALAARCARRLAVGVGPGFAGSADRLADGVTIAGVDVGGMTPAEREGAARERAPAQADVPSSFAAGGQRWQIAPTELGVVADWDAAVDDAMDKGGGFDAASAASVASGCASSPADVEPSVHAYEQRREYKVSLLAEDDRPAAPRRRLVRHGLSFELVGGQTGRQARPRRGGRGGRRRSPASTARAHDAPGRGRPPKVTVAELRRCARARDAGRLGPGHAEDRHRQLRRRAEEARGHARAAERRHAGPAFGGPRPPRTSASSTAT